MVIFVVPTILIGKKFLLVAKEYWNKELTKIDTVANISDTPIPSLWSDSLIIKVLSEKSSADSLRINFDFKGLFGLTKKYQTTKSATYATMNLI